MQALPLVWQLQREPWVAAHRRWFFGQHLFSTSLRMALDLTMMSFYPTFLAAGHSPEAGAGQRYLLVSLAGFLDLLRLARQSHRRFASYASKRGGEGATLSIREVPTHLNVDDPSGTVRLARSQLTLSTIGSTLCIDAGTRTLLVPQVSITEGDPQSLSRAAATPDAPPAPAESLALEAPAWPHALRQALQIDPRDTAWQPIEAALSAALLGTMLPLGTPALLGLAAARWLAWLLWRAHTLRAHGPTTLTRDADGLWIGEAAYLQALQPHATLSGPDDRLTLRSGKLRWHFRCSQADMLRRWLREAAPQQVDARPA